MARVTWNSKQVIDSIKATQSQSMNDACEFLSDKIKDSMKPGTGRWWPSKKGDGSLHQASIPNTAPAPDTEELKNSISWAASTGSSGGGEGSEKVTAPFYGANTNIIAGKIGTTNGKGILHEMAWTIDGAKRPFIRPAFTESEDELIRILGKNKI
ncbi:MAG: hypothetical protein WC055_00370 [Melioribacteraceae bacterium]